MVIEADSGTIVQKLAYSPFGRILQDTNPGFQPFAYAGGQMTTPPQLAER